MAEELIPREERDSLDTRPVDLATSVVRSVAGALPVIGPALAELTAAISGQRIDRIADFAKNLDVRLSRVELTLVESRAVGPECGYLLEESLRDAEHAVSGDRRAQIAEIVSRSLSTEQVSHAEARHLLSILRDLNDVEIVRLGAYCHPIGYDGSGRDYHDAHREVLEPRKASYVSPQEEKDRVTFQRSYDQHLERLDLIAEMESSVVGRKLAPHNIPSYQLTDLGGLLCRQIGLMDEEDV